MPPSPTATVPEIVLASSSRYRRELMARLRLPVHALSPEVDESPRHGETPQAYVQRLAEQKARAVSRHRGSGSGPGPGAGSTSPTRLVIGSDQTAVLDGELLGKPGCFEAARVQLERASGRSVDFFTGLAVVHDPSGMAAVDVVSTRVTFRALEPAEIERYLRAEAPYDCAGGFKCEGLGIALFRSIESSDPTALIGLPLIRLAEMLRSFGVAVP